MKAQSVFIYWYTVVQLSNPTKIAKYLFSTDSLKCLAFYG